MVLKFLSERRVFFIRIKAGLTLPVQVQWLCQAPRACLCCSLGRAPQGSCPENSLQMRLHDRLPSLAQSRFLVLNLLETISGFFFIQSSSVPVLSH